MSPKATSASWASKVDRSQEGWWWTCSPLLISEFAELANQNSIIQELYTSSENGRCFNDPHADQSAYSKRKEFNNVTQHLFWSCFCVPFKRHFLEKFTSCGFQYPNRSPGIVPCWLSRHPVPWPLQQLPLRSRVSRHAPSHVGRMIIPLLLEV